MEGTDNLRAAIGVIAVLLTVKIISGIVLLFPFPISETASPYAALHPGVLFGVVPLAIIFGSSALFRWRILRLRSRRRYSGSNGTSTGKRGSALPSKRSDDHPSRLIGAHNNSKP